MSSAKGRRLSLVAVLTACGQQGRLSGGGEVWVEMSLQWGHLPFEGISSCRCGSLSRWGKDRYSAVFISQSAVLFVYMCTIVKKTGSQGVVWGSWSSLCPPSPQNTTPPKGILICRWGQINSTYTSTAHNIQDSLIMMCTNALNSFSYKSILHKTHKVLHRKTCKLKLMKHVFTGCYSCYSTMISH